MDKTYKTYNKTYYLPNCDIRLKLKYLADNLGTFEFNFDCISLGEIESGYEDDDLLTFYPNVLKLAFTDVRRYNYEQLRLVLESYPSLNNYEVTQLELWYNKKNETPIRKFIGFIDKKSLRYSEKERILEFDVLDNNQQLKYLTIDDLNGERSSVPYYIYSIFKKIYPDLNYNPTNDINVFKDINFNGIYWKHNWEFESYLTHVIKDFITGYEDIQFYQIWNNPLFNKDNYANLLKAIANQFGMTIGCEEPNKIYAYKRFVSQSFILWNAIDLTSYLINNYTKELWLPNIICVRNSFPTYNSGTQTVRAGTYIPNKHDISKPTNLDTLLEIQTDMTTNINYSSWMYMSVNTGTGYEVIQYLTDPDINVRGRLEDVIAHLYLNGRAKSKDKYEFELYGINYTMADYYTIQQEGFTKKALRPLVLKKDLIGNKTKMTALEIGFNIT